MYYYAYGTNTDIRAMTIRCPKAKVIGVATLRDYRNSGLNIYPKENCSVEGILWEITDACLASLDVYEGYPTLYIRNWITVETDDGEVEALVYRIE